MLVSLACAQIAPPSGGPEDRDAPRLAGQRPDSAAVRVPLDQPVELCFTEDMDRGSVRDWLVVNPWPGRLDCAWVKACYACRPVEGWSPATTYTVFLGTQARDRHAHALASPLRFAFSTGDSLARGLLAGEVRTRGLPREKVPVYLFAWPAGARGPQEAPAPEPLEALRAAESDAEGRFLFEYVPTGVDLLVAALFDRGGDRGYDPDEDLWGFAEWPVRSGVAGDTATALLYLVYNDEEGDLTGTVVDSSCVGYAPPARLAAEADSLRAILSGGRDASGFLVAGSDTTARLRPTEAQAESLQSQLARLEARRARAAGDSVRCSSPIWVAAYAAEADSLPAAEVSTLGEFRLAALPPGVYRLQAYRDLDRDGRRGADEPQGAFPLVVEVRPGRELSGLDWPLLPGGR